MNGDPGRWGIGVMTMGGVVAMQGTLAVFVPTFRRPATLAETLDSLAAQDTATAFRVFVADNDQPAAEGGRRAIEWAAERGWVGRVVVVAAPERGLSQCRNTGLAAAFADPAVAAVAMIDDDATAHPLWYVGLTAALERYNPDLLGGPTVYHFGTTATATVRSAEMFGVPFRASGVVPQLRSSNNCVVTRRLYDAWGPSLFDPAFGRTGGEDVDLFSRCRAQGRVMAWAAEAEVHEFVPDQRATEAWVAARHALSAINAARIDCRVLGRLRGTARQVGLALKECGGGLARLASFDRQRRFVGRLRLNGAIGRLKGLADRPGIQY